MEECAKIPPATCSAWTGMLALAEEQELPLRVPERTAGDAAFHCSLHTELGDQGQLTHVPWHAMSEGKGTERPPHPCLTALHPAEATTECTRIVQLGIHLRQKRLKPQGDQIKPTPSSRTRNGVLGEEKEKPAMKQSATQDHGVTSSQFWLIGKCRLFALKRSGPGY